MRTRRLLFFSLVLLLVSLACSLRPFWSGPVAGPIEQTETPVFVSGIGIGNFNHGELKILYDQAKVSTANEGWFKPMFGCWPASYYDDGSGYLKLTDDIILGFCSWTSPSAVNPSVTWNTRGNLQGYLVRSLTQGTNEIEFEFDTQANYFTHTVDIKFMGQGSMTTSDHAEGIATFSATCYSSGPEDMCTHTAGNDVIRRKSWQINGSVPWTMDFTP